MTERVWKWFAIGNGCWEWEAHRDRDGYGRIGGTLIRGEPSRTLLAHRVVYELLRGSIPEGLTLDHLCRNRGCVNPWHLEPVTNGENVLRGNGITARQARQTHCVHGHEYTEANTYRHPQRGTRDCRACQKIRHKKHSS